MDVGGIASTQVNEPLMGTGVEDIPSTFNRVSIAVVETGSESTPPVPTPAMDILEGLSLQMVRQFFTTMEYCTELVFLGEVPSSSYERSLRARLKTSGRLGVLIKREHIKY